MAKKVSKKSSKKDIRYLIELSSNGNLLNEIEFEEGVLVLEKTLINTEDSVSLNVIANQNELRKLKAIEGLQINVIGDAEEIGKAKISFVGKGNRYTKRIQELRKQK